MTPLKFSILPKQRAIRELKLKKKKNQNSIFFFLPIPSTPGLTHESSQRQHGQQDLVDFKQDMVLYATVQLLYTELPGARLTFNLLFLCSTLCLWTCNPKAESPRDMRLWSWQSITCGSVEWKHSNALFSYIPRVQGQSIQKALTQ